MNVEICLLVGSLSSKAVPVDAENCTDLIDANHSRKYCKPVPLID